MCIRDRAQAGKSLVKTIQSVVQAVAANPAVWIALLLIILVAAIVGAIGAVVGSGGAANESQDGTYQAQVSGKTESFRELVSEYCEKYGIDDYVDLCLADVSYTHLVSFLLPCLRIRPSCCSMSDGRHGTSK